MFYRDAQGTFAENQKSQAVRKAFQRAVVIPISNLEQLWKEYNYFENVSSNFCCGSVVCINVYECFVSSKISLLFVVQGDPASKLQRH